MPKFDEAQIATARLNEYGNSSRLARWLVLAQTMNFTQIAAQEGLTRERVRQVFLEAGYTGPSFGVPCAICGEKTRSRQARAKVCGKQACQNERMNRWNAAKRPPRDHAVCSSCGKVLHLYPKPNGDPSFCVGTNACQAAKQRWITRNDPNVIAYYDAYRKSERGREVQRQASRRHYAKQREARDARTGVKGER